MWLNYGVPKVEGLTLSVLEDLASGLPYGAVGTVDARPFVAASSPAVAAAYATPQGGASETYYFTARDAFRTEASRRTDFAANYSRAIGTGPRKLTAFVQAQVLNVFNQQELCGCGGTIFQNGGTGQLNTIQGASAGESVLTSLNTATLRTFNPLTTAPGPRHQLELQRQLRHAEEPLRVHVAAGVPAELRGSLLEPRCIEDCG